MGKVGQLVMEAQQFAQDHLDVERDEFYKLAAEYDWAYSIQLREAVAPRRWRRISQSAERGRFLLRSAVRRNSRRMGEPLYRGECPRGACGE